MGTFPQTRAGAGYIARHARGELARGRAAVLLTALDACEDVPAGGDVPAVFHGVLRDLVLAARDLAGPAWLAAASDDPDIAAFTALQATPVPPSPAELDEIISRVLRARFAPPGLARDDGGGPGPAPGPAAGHDVAVRSHVPAASHSQRSPAQLRRGIAYVIQETGLFPHRTVEDNIATVPPQHKPRRRIP